MWAGVAGSARGCAIVCSAALAIAAGASGCSGSAAQARPPSRAEASPAAREAATETTRSDSRPVVLPGGDWRTAYRDHVALRVLTGAASYYHDSLAGRSTASGEPYDPQAFTAASRDLAFGTVLRVVRADTGTSCIVRVNDRGPFGRRRRLLDLSRAAAEQLGMIERGVVQVRAEVLEDGPPRARRGRR